MEKVTKKPLPELEESRNWQGSLIYVWQWYIKLSVNSPLSFLELDAWSRLMGFQLTSLESETLMEIDRLNRNSNHG